jgi:hypothetical protein
MDEARSRLVSGLLDEEVDWDRLVELARRHGTVPLLYNGLRVAAPEKVPSALMTSLRGRFGELARRNLYQIVELIGLLKELGDGGVPAIPFKGPVLAEQVYGNLALREFSDLDILIRPEHVDRASGILQDRGYRPWYEPSEARQRAAKDLEYALPFSRATDRMSVDLHWAFARKFFAADLDEELVWSRAVTGKLQRREALLLPPALTPIVLAVHGAKHGPYPWPRIKWIADMAGVAAVTSPEDWREALALARQLGVLRMLLLGVALAERVLDAAVPTAVARTLDDDPAARRLAVQVEQWLLFDSRPAPAFAERVSFDVSVRERRRDRLRYLGRRLFTPTNQDLDAVSLPAGLSFLYPALRWVRLGSRYLGHPSRLKQLWRGRDQAEPPSDGTEPAAVVRDPERQATRSPRATSAPRERPVKS